MKNPKIQSFTQEEFPIISACQVARCVRQKNLCLGQKNQNLQNVFQISWNLGWVSSIMHYAGPRKLWPKFEVYHAFCDTLMPSLTLPSGSWFVPCKHYFLPNNDSSCASTCSFPFFPSPTASPNEYWPSQAKFLNQPQSLAQWMSSRFGSFGQLASSHVYFATPW